MIVFFCVKKYCKFFFLLPNSKQTLIGIKIYHYLNTTQIIYTIWYEYIYTFE